MWRVWILFYCRLSCPVHGFYNYSLDIVVVVGQVSAVLGHSADSGQLRGRDVRRRRIDGKPFTVLELIEM